MSRDDAGRGLAHWLATAGRALVDLLFPPHCVACGRAGPLFCAACQARIEPLPAPACPRCGRPGVSNALCRTCRTTPSPLDAITAVGVFAPPLREAIHRFKYDNLHALAAPLAALLAAHWLDAGLSADVIVPVPLHARRAAERGYNQSALLAGAVSQAVGVPVAELLLVRSRATRPQVGLDISSRRANVAGAFAARGRADGSRVILIDDVCTTGATLAACAAALREAGAARVAALTLARARWEPENA